jgi:hypothetical protein
MRRPEGGWEWGWGKKAVVFRGVCLLFMGVGSCNRFFFFSFFLFSDCALCTYLGYLLHTNVYMNGSQ